MKFPVAYDQIVERLQQLRPAKYAATRNFMDGNVTYLSPYISRGVISVNQVKEEVLKTCTLKQCYKLIQELAWREYWQRVWQNKGDALFTDLKYPQAGVEHYGMITNINLAATTIKALDENIRLLYTTGYMHNHMRMYVASLACNIGKAHWLQPAKWLYYHLLDADPASNHLSWQWVAGSFSSKKYYCNQENINRYTYSDQKDSYLDKPYPELTKMPVPPELKDSNQLNLETVLPIFNKPEINKKLPALIYNTFNLDPLWRKDENANRILLLEPSYFNKFPSGEKLIDFIIGLSKNIKGLKIYAGEISEIFSQTDNVISKEHPASNYYPGVKDSREWMFPEVQGYYPSFSAFWKKCEKTL